MRCKARVVTKELLQVQGMGFGETFVHMVQGSPSTGSVGTGRASYLRSLSI